MLKPERKIIKRVPKIKEKDTKKVKRKRIIRNYNHKQCKECGSIISGKSNSRLCVTCSSILKRKTERPSKENLEEMIKTMPFVQIAKLYNVSDNSIRKWCKGYGILYRKKDTI